MAGQPDEFRRARGPQQDAGEPPSEACPNLAQRPRHLLSLRSIRQNLNRLIHGLSGLPEALGKVLAVDGSFFVAAAAPP